MFSILTGVANSGDFASSWVRPERTPDVQSRVRRGPLWAVRAGSTGPQDFRGAHRGRQTVGQGSRGDLRRGVSAADEARRATCGGTFGKAEAVPRGGQFAV